MGDGVLTISETQAAWRTFQILIVFLDIYWHVVTFRDVEVNWEAFGCVCEEEVGCWRDLLPG